MTKKGQEPKLDYREFIVATPEHLCFLHRCTERVLQSILQQGLVSGEDLFSCASSQLSDLEIAEQSYRNGGNNYGNQTAVIHIPGELWGVARSKARRSEVSTREIGYFHPIKMDFTVRPKFVVASINRDTNVVSLNPYVDRRPVEGHEEFDEFLS